MTAQTRIKILDTLIGFGFKILMMLYFENYFNNLAFPSIIASVYFGIQILL